MNEVIDNSLELHEFEDLGSDWHGYLQSNIGAYFRYEQRNKYICIAELSLNIQKPYIQPNGKESYIVKPDLAIYPIEDKPKRNIDNLSVSKMPLCAIEILSPRQALSELFDKTKVYLENGIQSCWIVIPNFESIYIFNKSIDNKEFYTIKQKIIDEILDIELQASELFE